MDLCVYVCMWSIFFLKKKVFGLEIFEIWSDIYILEDLVLGIFALRSV